MIINHYAKHIFSSAALLAMLSTTAGATTTLPAEMPEGLYTLDETHASLTWKVSHMGLSNYTARFTDFDAELDFNPKAPAESSLTVTIDPTSLKTDYPYPEKKDFDAKLTKGEDWFNSEKFPKITYTSTKITQTSPNTGTITGDLTFLGVTKPLVLQVKFNDAMAMQPFSKKPTLGFSATGTLSRSEWGMDTYVPNIGDEVELLIEAEFAKSNK
jgi:polyisoprenoid-binding protein YceI